MPTLTPSFLSVYGPVRSWRFGRSLGIDPIGPVSVCSFNCAYCQLGEIQQQTHQRQVFIPTEQIRRELQAMSFEAIDTITLSGSGEPTLAQNLGEILTLVKEVTTVPVGVLTNGTLLCDRTVRKELAIADWVAVKLDAVSVDQFRRINHPVAGLHLADVWEGLLHFRKEYSGQLYVQTMLLSDWTDAQQAEYIRKMQTLMPDEIQLNTPTRPKPLTHELAARGNHAPGACPYPTRALKRVSAAALQTFGDRIESVVGIPVRRPQLAD